MRRLVSGPETAAGDSEDETEDTGPKKASISPACSKRFGANVKPKTTKNHQIMNLPSCSVSLQVAPDFEAEVLRSRYSALYLYHLAPPREHALLLGECQQSK